MRTSSLLLSLGLGLIPTSSALSDGQEQNIDGPILARSAARPLKGEAGMATSHLHRRHEQPANQANPKSRSKKKRQSFIDSLLANAGLNSGETYILETSTTGTPDATDTTDASNTDTETTNNNNPPAEKAQAAPINDTPASSPASSPIPAAPSSQNPATSPEPASPSTSSTPGTCASTTPSGCANEDGASTGDPHWTCPSSSSGTTTPSNNNKRTLLRSHPHLHPRQSTPSYVNTLNTYRCLFCLPPLLHSPSLETSARRQATDSASQNRMVETPPSGEGTVMAIGGGTDFETSLLFWLCEVHTTNMDSCTCANAYGRPGFTFTWTERGHYDFLAGKEAAQFGSVGCVYDEAMGGLWTCALGIKGGE